MQDTVELFNHVSGKIIANIMNMCMVYQINIKIMTKIFLYEYLIFFNKEGLK